MGKNYDALHYIQKQLQEFDQGLTNAVQRLFNIEDQAKESQGCVIDSVAMQLLFKKFGIQADIHIGEICADGNQNAYHCWLTVNDRLIDIGIYGNSNYNPYYCGPRLNRPIIMEEFSSFQSLIYAEGSTEVSGSWLAELSEKYIVDYIAHCPQDRVCHLVCKSLNISYNQENRRMIRDLGAGLKFPKLKKLMISPSGKSGER